MLHLCLESVKMLSNIKVTSIQGVKKIMVTPIIQNMAYFLSFHAEVMKKSHWLGIDAADESSKPNQCEFFHSFGITRSK